MSDAISRRGVIAGAAAGAALAAAPASATPVEPALTRIAFGSCAHQDKEQPIWNLVNAWNPELFIFLGDNVYGDTEDMAVLRAKYQKLADKPGFRTLRRKAQVIATWDDHDFGVNDGGSEYPKKEESAALFLDFWGVPADHPRRSHSGIYGSYSFGPEGRRVQVILPDNRTFRTPLLVTALPTSHHTRSAGRHSGDDTLADAEPLSAPVRCDGDVTCKPPQESMVANMVSTG